MQRGFRTYTTLRAALGACGVFIGTIVLTLLIFEPPALMLSVMTLMAGPAILMIIGLWAGFLPMGVCLILLTAAFGLSGPLALMGFAVLYLAPVTLAWVCCSLRQTPFFLCFGLLAAVLAVSQLIIFIILEAITGGQLYLTAGSLAAQALYDLPWRDSLLYTLVTSGFLEIPLSMRETAIVTLPTGNALSMEVISELLLQVRGYVQSLLEGVFPSLLVSGSGLNALLGISLSLRWGQRAAQRRAVRLDEDALPLPNLGMPPLRTWHLPRPWGLRIGILGLGYFLAKYADGSLASLGAMMFQVFSFCFGVQALADINEAQHRRGSSRGWRTAVVVLSLLLRFMQIALIVLGVMDQITNARKLRPPIRLP